MIHILDLSSSSNKVDVISVNGSETSKEIEGNILKKIRNIQLQCMP